MVTQYDVSTSTRASRFGGASAGSPSPLNGSRICTVRPALPLLPGAGAFSPSRLNPSSSEAMALLMMPHKLPVIV